MADLIKSIPGRIVESFKDSPPVDQRRARMLSACNEIDVGMLPVISWMERRTDSAKADLIKRRLRLVLDGAVDCVGYDIAEYVTGTPRRVSKVTSAGAAKAAVLLVTCMVFAALLHDQAGDIEQDEIEQARLAEPVISNREGARLYSKAMGTDPDHKWIGELVRDNDLRLQLCSDGKLRARNISCLAAAIQAERSKRHIPSGGRYVCRQCGQRFNKWTTRKVSILLCRQCFSNTTPCLK
jgi:hypothetical protein